MPYTRQDLIDETTGEINWVAVKELARARAVREYGTMDPPPCYVRYALSDIRHIAYLEQGYWRRRQEPRQAHEIAPAAFNPDELFNAVLARLPHWDTDEIEEVLEGYRKEAAGYFADATKRQKAIFDATLASVRSIIGSPRWEIKRLAAQKAFEVTTKEAAALYDRTMSEFAIHGEMSDETSEAWTALERQNDELFLDNQLDAIACAMQEHQQTLTVVDHAAEISRSAA